MLAVTRRIGVSFARLNEALPPILNARSAKRLRELPPALFFGITIAPAIFPPHRPNNASTTPAQPLLLARAPIAADNHRPKADASPFRTSHAAKAHHKPGTGCRRGSKYLPSVRRSTWPRPSGFRE
ncbi:hypothetical protein HYPSUDRAFT_202932 [Hypholoma sublateritium FD-334 SS-4]|uniref:Uncharacterized protein n=1 Tax=Hypholoma sublateritium (strain FD-334 SS-4) TaxID=945553 RepID=A0A0D2MDK1_HYPSF|nr:hypothetical protein HYPSUDRAFT_202932 [Hypholoma sublateritium FD-334 SS-4]